MVKLPGGFSPVNFAKQAVDPLGFFVDADVFSDYSVRGGDRSPADGSFVGPQVQGATTTAPNTGLRIDSGSYSGTANHPSSTVSEFNTPQATGSGGGVDPLAQNRQNQQFINAQADLTKSKLSSILSTLDPQQNVANAKVLNQFQTSRNDLLGNKATGDRNLNYADQQVQGNKIRDLKTLGDRIRQMNFSYSNQLGAYGAGDSSAAGLISNAVAQQGANSRGDILRGASDQQTQIGFQREDLERAFTGSMTKLDEWKQNNLADIASSFAEKKNQIQEAMATADASRYQELAQLDASFTAQALDSLKNLENMYQGQANDLVSRFKTILGPQNVGIAPGLQEFAVQEVNPSELAGLRMPQQVNPEDNLTSILKRRDEKDQIV